MSFYSVLINAKFAKWNGSNKCEFSDFHANKWYAIFSVITSVYREEKDAFVCVVAFVSREK